MLSHEQIWRGIDRLAEQAGLSPSGLARRAGLDATTFNPSKRMSADGAKPRWPSTESLAKALAAAGVDFEMFAAMATGGGAGPRLISPRPASARPSTRPGFPRARPGRACRSWGWMTATPM